LQTFTSIGKTTIFSTVFDAAYAAFIILSVKYLNLFFINYLSMAVEINYLFFYR